MAELNKVLLIGRLTSDPEIRTFSNGGKLSTFRFAVNNRKRNQTTGQWEKQPCYIDCRAANREHGKQLADTVEKFLTKGSQICIEGHLILDQWVSSKTNEKVQKLRVVVDDVQFLDLKDRNGKSTGPMSRTSPSVKGDDSDADYVPSYHSSSESPTDEFEGVEYLDTPF